MVVNFLFQHFVKNSGGKVYTSTVFFEFGGVTLLYNKNLNNMIKEIHIYIRHCRLAPFPFDYDAAFVANIIARDTNKTTSFSMLLVFSACFLRAAFAKSFAAKNFFLYLRSSLAD